MYQTLKIDHNNLNKIYISSSKSILLVTGVMDVPIKPIVYKFNEVMTDVETASSDLSVGNFGVVFDSGKTLINDFSSSITSTKMTMSTYLGQC